MHTHTTSIVFFLIFFAISVGITVWASRQNRSAGAYLVADGGIAAWQNGLAMSGEYLSASALLGMSGLIATEGFNGYIYSIAAATTWPLMLFLVADPVRRLGKFTLTDVLAWRLRQRPVRIVAAVASIPITLFYLIGQLVAGGVLVKLLFGMSYTPAVLLVGAITLAYVLFGGMLATTWVQIIKACLLSVGVLILTLLLLAKFGFNPAAMFRQIGSHAGQHFLSPASLPAAGRWDVASLALGLVCGGLGMPQILTRFFTVPDPHAARKSALYSTGIVGVFHMMVLLLGFGAMALLGRDTILGAGGGGNMAVPLLAEYLGGDTFFGFISGVSFATVLAVIAGLTLASATTFAHDLWAKVVRAGSESHAGGQEPATSLRVAQVSAVIIAVVATSMALLFQGVNVAFLIGLAQALAAASNFPILMMALYWRGLTTRGAVWGMAIGVVSSLVLIIVSPTVQIALLHGNKAWLMQQWWYFSLSSPTIVSMPLAVLTTVIVSWIRPELAAQQRYVEMRSILDEATPTRHAFAPATSTSIVRH